MVALGRREQLVVYVVVALFIAHAALFLGGVIDDAYISFRYARNLVDGHGLVFNVGERVEGFTNFSWVLLSALSLALGLAPDLTLPVLGTLAGAALTLVAARAAARMPAREARGRAGGGIVAAGLVALSPGLAFYAVSGLEQTLFALLVMGASVALVERRLVAFSLWTSIAFLTRPEAGLLGVLAVLLLLHEVLSAGGLRAMSWRTRLWPAIAILALCVGPFLAFKQGYFGSIVPNTLHAKEPNLALAAHYTLMGSLPSAPIAAFTLVASWRGGWSRQRTELLLIWAAFSLSCVIVGPDWMPAYRFLLPALPLLAIASDGPLSAALRALQGRGGRALGALSIAVLGCYLAWSVPKSISLSESTRSWPARDDLSRRLAAELGRTGVRSVATINIGLLAYAANDITFVDLAGLVDAEIGSGPGGHLNKRPSDAYLSARDPDMFVLTSSRPIDVGPTQHATYVPDSEVERYVFSRPWFMQRYQYAGSIRFYAHHFYHLFRRVRPGPRQQAATGAP